MTKIIANIRQIPTNLRINISFPAAKKFLIGLLAVDFLFILLHLYSLFLPVAEESTLQMRLDMDFGYAEIFQYFQFISTSLLLIFYFIRERKGVYLIWSFFFFILFLDDAFRFHEIYGQNFAHMFNISAQFGLRGKDLGELAIAAILGATFVFPFMHALFFGNKKSQETTLHLILLVGVLVFFGMGIDMLHSMLRTVPGSGILTIIEDGGELFAGSLIVYYMICLHLTEKKNIVTDVTEKIKIN